MDSDLNSIIHFLKKEREVDFSKYNSSMIERRIINRMEKLNEIKFSQYREYLENHPEEGEILADTLTINVSRFFRNALTFEYLKNIILPIMIKKKQEEPNPFFRVWSAGCSEGEEPYSLAILLNEIICKEDLKLKLNIFATDINRKALQTAQKGVYSEESLKNMKHGLIKKYLSVDDNSFKISPGIKDLVTFSYHDLLDQHTYIPAESIFGDFDIVACRNVLIYFNPAIQEKVFSKLHRSLRDGGILILGSSETIPEKFKKKYKIADRFCRIYRKII